MATFAYSGRSRAGQSVAGERIAETMEAAISALRREQIQVTQITPVKEKAAKKAKAKGASAKDLAVFTRQFSVMIGAGLPLVQCLDILGTQAEDKNFGANHSRHPCGRRERDVACRRDEETPEGVRCPVHKHDRRG